MKLEILRDRSGEVIGTYEPGELQTASGTVEVHAEPEDGQEVESIEIASRELFDVDSLHKRLRK